MGVKLRQYTPLGARIDALCGPQHKIAAALGLDRSQISRKLRGEIALTVEELVNISNHFEIPIWLFFTNLRNDLVDEDVMHQCCRMFRYNPLALDKIIRAFNIDHKNLKRTGDAADEMRLERDRERRERYALSGGRSAPDSNNLE